MDKNDAKKLRALPPELALLCLSLMDNEHDALALVMSVLCSSKEEACDLYASCLEAMAEEMLARAAHLRKVAAALPEVKAAGRAAAEVIARAARRDP